MREQMRYITTKRQQKEKIDPLQPSSMSSRVEIALEFQVETRIAELWDAPNKTLGNENMYF